MAYDFNIASTQYLITSSTPVANVPLTVACWVLKETGGLNGRTVMSLANSASSQTRITLISDDNGMVVLAAQGESGGAFTSSVGVSVLGTWVHAAGVLASTTSRTAYADGVAGTTNTDSVTLTGINRIGIGARVRKEIDLYHDGLIAEVGIWNVALTAAEIAALAKGVTCDKVRPQSLKFYAPLIRNLQDVRGGVTITNNNGATVANHPRVYK
jgi:hypothetical protein